MNTEYGISDGNTLYRHTRNKNQIETLQCSVSFSFFKSI